MHVVPKPNTKTRSGRPRGTAHRALEPGLAFARLAGFLLLPGRPSKADGPGSPHKVLLGDGFRPKGLSVWGGPPTVPPLPRVQTRKLSGSRPGRVRSRGRRSGPRIPSLAHGGGAGDWAQGWPQTTPALRRRRGSRGGGLWVARPSPAGPGRARRGQVAPRRLPACLSRGRGGARRAPRREGGKPGAPGP